MIKVIVYPKGDNPYQNLLYSEINHSIVEVKYFSELTKSRSINLLLFYPQLFIYKLKGYEIFHLHWLNFFIPSNYVIIQMCSLINTLLSVFWIKIIGFKLVWTVHNIKPHKKETFNDLWISRLVSNFANYVIVHSKQSIQNIKINHNNYSVIPIGNYSQYKNNISISQARYNLGYKKTDIVFAFIGSVKKYKGVLNLLKTFTELFQYDDKAKLIIAGKIDDKELATEMNYYRTILSDNLKIIDEYIQDDQLQDYFKTANWAVFPYLEITTSSSIMLALYFNLPIIGPNLGNLSDLPNNMGFIYNSNDKDGLKKSLICARSMNFDFEKFSLSNNKFLSSISWKQIALKTENVYKKVLK